jgi:hypothetical protein
MPEMILFLCDSEAAAKADVSFTSQLLPHHVKGHDVKDLLPRPYCNAKRSYRTLSTPNASWTS